MRIRLTRFWPLMVLAACTDLPNEPGTRSAPTIAALAKGGNQGGNGKTSLDLIEDDVAAGALDKQNANFYREAALSDPTKLPAKYQSSAKGKDATLSLVQMAKDWSSLSKSSQQQILDLRAKGLASCPSRSRRRTSCFEGFPPNDEDVTGNETIRSGALKVTQAHEFMHAIQFNINVLQSGWLFESHATWAEDAVYDGLNDWHWYINRSLATPDLPLFSRYLYGAAFFQNWLSETYGVDITRQIWLAAKTNTMPDAIRLTAFGGSWEPLKTFAVAEYTLGISDFTSDGPSVIPLPTSLPIRATHTTYPVAVSVGPSTNKVDNRAPWGFGGSNYVEFVPGGSGTLTITFDGTDGFAWRALAVATPKTGGSPTIFPISLNSAGAGSVSVTGFGTKWSKVTLVPSIVGTDGSEVTYSYGASVN